MLILFKFSYIFYQIKKYFLIKNIDLYVRTNFITYVIITDF